MARYLVTGGCGFIGSPLVKTLLEDGHQVRILDDLSTGKIENVSRKCEVVVGDVTDCDLVDECMKDIDACYHLAAIDRYLDSSVNLMRMHQVNQTGTINVFGACRKNKTPVVYASSSAVYGDNAAMPLKETSELRPSTFYGADKLASESYARVASLVYGVPTTGMRLFNVYGPLQNSVMPCSNVVSVFVKRILNHQHLYVYGDGYQARDFIYVDDVVVFMRLAMENISRAPCVFNVCTGKSTSINQLAKTIMSIAGLNVSVEHDASRKGDIRVSVGDPGYAKKMLSVTVDKTLMDGIRLLIESYKDESLNGETDKYNLLKTNRRHLKKLVSFPFIDCLGVLVIEDRRVSVYG